MHTLKINPMALIDLNEIKNYITNELCSPEAAKRQVLRIIERYESLKSHPFLGTDLNSRIGVHTNYRYLTCDNYIIFYKVENDEILIYRILYGARDYMKLLFDKE